MSLILEIVNRQALDNGGPMRLQVDQRGAVIGRSPKVEWCLPDPLNYVSSRHCEIAVRGHHYVVTDTSTNGTLVNGVKLSGAHPLTNGDVLTIGPYEIRALVAKMERTARQGHEPDATTQSWPPLAPSGRGSASHPVDWWSEASAAENPWGKLADTNDVDWSRGGFHFEDGAASSTPPSSTPPRSAAEPNPIVESMLRAAGLNRSQIKLSDSSLAQAVGWLLRRMVSGMVVMLEARARAKAELGAQSTGFDFDGNNPMKFARTPDQALAHLLNPPEPGFMKPDRAVEDAFRDLQSHQVATLKAMQGALKATLDRFSPEAIRSRASAQGLLSKIMPAARDAALWQAYEKEFGGVVHAADDTFIEVFAQEFRKAYDDQAARNRRR